MLHPLLISGICPRCPCHTYDHVTRRSALIFFLHCKIYSLFISWNVFSGCKKIDKNSGLRWLGETMWAYLEFLGIYWTIFLGLSALWCIYSSDDMLMCNFLTLNSSYKNKFQRFRNRYLYFHRAPDVLEAHTYPIPLWICRVYSLPNFLHAGWLTFWEDKYRLSVLQQ